MRVTPNPDDRAAADATHKQFVSLAGARHIASREALRRVAAVLREHNIRSVLEFGAGIGTMTHLLLTYPKHDRVVVSTERNAFCQEQLLLNIPEKLRSRLTVVIDRAEPEGEFDLVIVDGSMPDYPNYNFLRPGAICIIEGGRRMQRQSIMNLLRKRGLSCTFHYSGKRHTPALKWTRTKSGGHDIRIKFPRWRKLFAHRCGCAIGMIR